METQLIGGRIGSENRWTWMRVPQPIAARRTPVTIIGVAIAVVALLLATQLPISGASANPGSVIDFEELAEGSIVNSVSVGNGISGDDPGGSVEVFGFNPTFPSTTPTAMIFDATCTPGGTPGDCTGNDADLFQTVQGNVLIICEEKNSTNTCKLPPDDADVPGEHFDLDFSDFGPGTVTIVSLIVGDVDALPGTIQVFSGGPGGTLEKTVNLPLTGDGVYEVVTINATGDFLRVNLNDSGAIDDIEIETEPEVSGRMTGGGSVIRTDGARVTRGFEIHCDLSEPNNLQVNWRGGNKFHLTSLTSADCTEDPDIIQDPPAADFDTFTGEGVGTLNGEPGHTISFVFVDAGEPGKNDTAEIKIDDGATLVVSGFIDVGNLQAH